MASGEPQPPGVIEPLTRESVAVPSRKSEALGTPSGSRAPLVMAPAATEGPVVQPLARTTVVALVAKPPESVTISCSS